MGGMKSDPVEKPRVERLQVEPNVAQQQAMQRKELAARKGRRSTVLTESLMNTTGGTFGGGGAN